MWGGLSGAGANPIVKLVLEPRRSINFFGFIRIGSGLRSGVARDITYIKSCVFIAIFQYYVNYILM